MVANALDGATEAGGRYYGFLEKRKGTSTGAADAAAAAWENAYYRMGAALEPIESGWNNFSAMIANDIANLANVFTQPKTTGGDQVDKAEQDRIAKREAAAKRLADLRAREAAAFKEMQARQAEQSKMAESGTMDAQFDLIKQMAPEAEVERFERLYGLLTDFNKEKAKIGVVENFKSGLGLGDLTDMLDQQAKLEWDRTEALREQSIEIAKQRDLRRETEENSKRLAEQYMSDDERMTKQLVDIELARRQGHLTGANYDRAINDVVGDRSRGGGSLASNMMMGSQQAYQFMAGIQDQRNRIEMSRHKESMTIQKLQLEVMKRVEQRLEELDLSTEK